MMVHPLSHNRGLKPSTTVQFPSPTCSYQTLPSQPLSLSSLLGDNRNSCPFYSPNVDFLTSQFGMFQPQEEGPLVTPMQIQGTSSSSSSIMKLDQGSLMFSDPIKQERVDFQNPSCSGFDQSHSQNEWSHTNALLDYSLEDVTRLIGSSNSESGNRNSSNFFSTNESNRSREEEILLPMYNY